MADDGRNDVTELIPLCGRHRSASSRREPGGPRCSAGARMFDYQTLRGRTDTDYGHLVAAAL